MKTANSEREESHMIMLSEISENLQKSKARVVREMVHNVIDEGVEPGRILKEGLLSGMNVIGEKHRYEIRQQR